VAGERQSPLTFSFIATIFLYVIGNAWVTLLPVYGPVQFRLSGGPEPVVPLLRGAGTDINMPLALALVAGIYVELHGLRIRGMAYVWEYFPLRPFLQRRVLTGLYESYLAMLHGLTHLARLFSFTFRLFGTLTA
jgi:F-type H+-transporting ATPase subunit a